MFQKHDITLIFILSAMFITANDYFSLCFLSYSLLNTVESLWAINTQFVTKMANFFFASGRTVSVTTLLNHIMRHMSLCFVIQIPIKTSKRFYDYFFFRFNSFIFCCITFDLDKSTSEHKLDLLTNNLKPYINYLLEFKTLRIFWKSLEGSMYCVESN